MARESRSHVNSILIFFFGCEGVVHYEFAPRGQTINKEYYVEVLKRCASAFNEPCAAIFGETQDCTASPASVQSRHCSLRLLDVPKIENGAQRKAVRRHRNDSE